MSQLSSLRKFFLTVVTFLCALPAWSQNNATLAVRLGKKQGFSEGSTYAIITDSKGFLWFGCSDGLWRYDGYTHVAYKHDPDDSTSLSNNFIRCLYEDKKGNIWVGTLGGGLDKLDLLTRKFIHFKHDKQDSTSISNNDINIVYEDAIGTLWIGAGVLQKFNDETQNFTHYPNKKNNLNSPGGNFILEIFTDKRGIMWLGLAGDGLDRFDPVNKKFKHFKISHPDPIINTRCNVIRKITEDNKGNLWIGTYGGLIRFDKKSEKITHWVHDEKNDQSLKHNSIWDLAPAGNKIWIASFGGGLSYFDTTTGLFEGKDFDVGGAYEINTKNIVSLLREKNGTIWVGSNHQGVYKIILIPGLKSLANSSALAGKNLDQVVKTKNNLYVVTESEGLTAFPHSGAAPFILKFDPNSSNSLVGKDISDLSEDADGNVWIGTEGGLTQYTAQGKRIQTYINKPGDSTSLNHGTVITTYVDPENNLWLGTPFGLDLFDRSTKKFIHRKTPLLSSNNVYRIRNVNGKLFLGTMTGGLNILDTRTNKTKWYQFNEKDINSISNNYITYIFKDSRNILWIGTKDGINRFDPDKEIFTRYGSKEGLEDLSVRTISEDINRNLLVETRDALFQLTESYLTNPPTDRNFFSRFDNPLEVLDIPFVMSPVDNCFYFTAGNQICFFPKDSIKINQAPPPIAITDFTILVNSRDKQGPDEKSLSPNLNNDIHLTYDQNIFSIEFVSLDFTNPKNNRYAYQLKGFDSRWINSGNRRFVTYTNLDPGTYTFTAKGSNADGIWNEQGASIRIIITPPFYKTWWAYAGYFIVFLGLLFWGWRSVVHRERLKMQVAVEQKEKNALKELDQLKTKFFSNITHEFRTPLTLIQGPTNELLERTSDPESKTLLNFILGNSQRLLKLINQLLDLAKLDAHEMKLFISNTHLPSLLKITISQFSSLAVDRKIQFTSELSESLPTVKTDSEKLETILSNLISNALKFTPPSGLVKVSAIVENEVLILKVIDNGRGIASNSINNIFDRFYQVTPTDSSHAEGTGIGLALVKEYSELMKGRVKVESNAEHGTTFTVTLPVMISDIEETVTRTVESNYGSAVSLNGAETDSNQSLILLVEDNIDIRGFIKSCLGHNYHYLEAGDGKEGLAIARKEVPDVIISDLMMPEMDGIEFCSLAKKDPRTDHIPFILLTAKAGEEHKIEGLQTGADDYLIKPFNKAELLLKVHNLILLREKLQVNIKSHLLSKATIIQATSASEQFILKAKTYIEANMPDEKLSVEALAAEMGMSREQCYRKIVAITGLTASGFIRKLRLQKAEQLLIAKWAPVSQVAYEVGFGNLSYFSKAFKEEFGRLPSEV